MSTIREANFSAAFDTDSLEGLKTVLEDIHHSNSICETDDDMETCRMESYAISLVIEELTDFESGWIGVMPDSHCLIN